MNGRTSGPRPGKVPDPRREAGADGESAGGRRDTGRSPTADRPERRRNEGPGEFPQRFDEGGTASDLRRHGYQRGDKGGYQGGVDDARYDEHPLERQPVSQPDADSDADARILQRVRQRLAEAGLPGGLEVAIAVSGGKVVLEGQVDRAADRDAIEAEVAQCGGVKAVGNRIAVRAR